MAAKKNKIQMVKSSWSLYPTTTTAPHESPVEFNATTGPENILKYAVDGLDCFKC